MPVAMRLGTPQLRAAGCMAAGSVVVWSIGQASAAIFRDQPPPPPQLLPATCCAVPHDACTAHTHLLSLHTSRSHSLPAARHTLRQPGSPLFASPRLGPLPLLLSDTTPALEPRAPAACRSWSPLLPSLFLCRTRLVSLQPHRRLPSPSSRSPASGLSAARSL